MTIVTEIRWNQVVDGEVGETVFQLDTWTHMESADAFVRGFTKGLRRTRCVYAVEWYQMSNTTESERDNA